MIEYLRLPPETFREISLGADTGPAGLTILEAIHRSRQHLLLRIVVDRLPAAARTHGMVKDALELLAQVQRDDRTAFNAILTYPHVGAGLVRCLHELGAKGDARSVGSFLATVAAAAAFQGGVEFNLGASTTAAMHIPAMGTAHLGGSLPEIRLRQRDGHGTVGPVAVSQQDSGGAAGWSEVRRLDSSSLAGIRTDTGQDIVLDDLDPDRGAGGLLPAGRLSPAEFIIWQEMFARAGERLAAAHPGWARQIGGILRAVTPLVRQRPSQGRSASTWQAYGAVALTLPGDDRSMAATLVHEIQHSKLNALLTVADLFDTADTSLHYSPWRADPRPLRGLLHGCYAFLGVASFWSTEHAATKQVAQTEADDRARYEFGKVSLQVRQGLDTLATVSGLTRLGRDFVACMDEWLTALPVTELPDPIRHLAELAVDDHRLSWRLRSLVPDSVKVSAIAAAWKAGRPISSLPVGAELERWVETFVPNDRIRLWSRLARQPASESDSEDPDILLARQASSAAAKRYLQEIRQEPESIDAWAGLAMAASRMDGPDRLLWLYRPELVRAVHTALRDPGGEPPDPLTLAGWLAEG